MNLNKLFSYKVEPIRNGSYREYIDKRLLGGDNKNPSLNDVLSQNKELSREQLLVKTNLSFPRVMKFEHIKKCYDFKNIKNKTNSNWKEVLDSFSKAKIPNWGSFVYNGMNIENQLNNK